MANKETLNKWRDACKKAQAELQAERNYQQTNKERVYALELALKAIQYSRTLNEAIDIAYKTLEGDSKHG